MVRFHPEPPVRVEEDVVHSMFAAAKLITGAVVLGLVAWLPLPTPWSAADRGAAYAQAKKAAPKKAAKKAPKAVPKQADKELVRTSFTAEEQAAAVIPGIPDARAWGDSDLEFRRLLPEASGPWLALSGGGADGAFGAGVMIGWTDSGTRPEFAVVSGVSIGALIAPYAFLGPSYDAQLRENFASITAADVFEDRSTGESLLDSWPLKRLIEKRMTPELLQAIAAEHRKGRRLLVGTTNMDAGRRVIWNMGAIAAKGDEKALKLFRDVLLASSSIPGFFQPVAIEVEAAGKTFAEMHLDGTVTAPFFVAPESTLAEAGPGLPTKQLFVIVNSKLSSEFFMPERKTMSVLSRTIGVALTTALKVELLLVNASVQRLGISLSAASVPDSFSQPNRGLFDHEYMQALFQFGAERAKNGSAFAGMSPPAPELRTRSPQ
jgi:predicted acylesterase/phospholipase RssA